MTKVRCTKSASPSFHVGECYEVRRNKLHGNEGKEFSLCGMASGMKVLTYPFGEFVVMNDFDFCSFETSISRICNDLRKYMILKDDLCVKVNPQVMGNLINNPCFHVEEGKVAGVSIIVDDNISSYLVTLLSPNYHDLIDIVGRRYDTIKVTALGCLDRYVVMRTWNNSKNNVKKFINDMDREVKFAMREKYALVEFDGTPKRYIFKCNIDDVKVGDTVVCDTRYGDAVAVVRTIHYGLPHKYEEFKPVKEIKCVVDSELIEEKNDLEGFFEDYLDGLGTINAVSRLLCTCNDKVLRAKYNRYKKICKKLEAQGYGC